MIDLEAGINEIVKGHAWQLMRSESDAHWPAALSLAKQPERADRARQVRTLGFLQSSEFVRRHGIDPSNNRLTSNIHASNNSVLMPDASEHLSFVNIHRNKK